MRAPVEHRTVSLWPSAASPLANRPQRLRGEQPAAPAADADDPAAEALAAITSRYRDGRAGIISGEPLLSAGPPSEEAPADPPPPVHLPTVPVAFLPQPTEAAPAPQVLPADQAREVAGFWFGSRGCGRRPGDDTLRRADLAVRSRLCRSPAGNTSAVIGVHLSCWT